MRYQPTQVSLESDELPPTEETIQYQEPENPFLDTLSATADDAAIEAAPEVIETAIVEDSAEVVDTANTIEDVAIAVESLESIAVYLNDLQKQGKSVSVESVALLNLSVDNATRKFPAFKQMKTVDSLENFTLDASSATTTSLENIGDKIKAGYEALKKFLKDLWEKFKAFLGNILSGAAQAEKKAKAHLDATKTANTDRRAGGEITIPAILNNPVLTTKAIQGLEAAVGSIGSVSYGDLLAVMERVKMRDRDITMESITSSLHKVFDAYARLGDDIYLGNLSFSNDQFPPTIKLVDGEARKAKPLTIPLVKEMLNENIKLCGQIAKLRQSLNERAKAISNLSSMMEMIANRQNNGVSQDVAARPDEVLRYLRSMMTILSKVKAFETRILGRAVQVANAINSVCEQSIKAHG